MQIAACEDLLRDEGWTWVRGDGSQEVWKKDEECVSLDVRTGIFSAIDPPDPKLNTSKQFTDKGP
jgi:hypothetical protein